MARTSKRSNNENLKSESKLFDKWAAAVSIIDKLMETARADIFLGLKYLVAEKIDKACGNDVTLSSYDIEIYEAYMRIIDTYKQVVDMYLDPNRSVTSLPVKEIWDGIYEVLMSRLVVISERDNLANPVMMEKKEIVSRIISTATEHMDAAAEHAAENCAADKDIDIRRRLLVAESISFEDIQGICAEIAENAKKHCVRDFYGIYISAVKLALVNLNDLSERHNVLYYNELLKEEQDLLRQIVMVQVMALEKASSEGLATGTEAKVMEEALNVLREAHQRESDEMERIEKLFNEIAAKYRENKGRVVTDVESEEEFAASFDEISPFGRDLPAIFEAMNQNFSKQQDAFSHDMAGFVAERLDAYVGKLVMQEIYYNKKAVSALVMMASDVSKCFDGILAYYSEHNEHLAQCDEKDIVKGVAETILIKIDSLNEAVDTFENDTDRLFGMFSQGEVAIDPDALILLQVYLVENLLPFGKKEENGGKIVRQLIDLAMEQRDFVEHRQTLEKSLAKKTEGLEKRMLAFMRDSFFYELSTFEEIMHYSVSRLRESADDCVIGFVTEIDAQYKHTGDILTKYGVEKIAPVAHDAFNPKENEVLMAEESEGFKKGEIIKTINSGYRQGDVIIMRANVIAAR